MAENNTAGAVHLTSLSLDLTQFNENIKQIENATAQVADVSVQNLSKIRDALNISGEQLKLNVDTSGLTQNINTTSESVKNLSNSTKEVVHEFENLNRLETGNIEALLRGLNLNINNKNKDKLEALRDALAGVEQEYSKLQIQTKGGDLFRATIQTADEAGRAIQTTFDLTGESVERLGSKIVEKSAQSSNALKGQAVDVEQLQAKFNGLALSAQAFADSVSNSTINLPAVPKLAEHANTLKENVIKANQALQNGTDSAEKANSSYDSFMKTLSSLSQRWKEITREANQATSSTSVNVNQIKQLALQYANLANTIQRSKISGDPIMSLRVQEIKETEDELKRLAKQLEDGNVTVAKATERYGELGSRLTEIRTQFADTGHEQEKLLKSSDLADELVNKYSKLQQSLAGLATRMSNQKLKFDSPELSNLIAETNKLSDQAGNIANVFRTIGTATDDATAGFDRFKQRADALNIAFERNKQSANDYQEALKPIKKQAQETASALKALEKNATFKSQKRQIADLRAEYENFVRKLKDTGISASDARKELDGLDARFKQLQGSVNTAGTVLGRFVNRLTETIRWRLANSAIMLIMRSFSGLTDTIIETENAVIELQRVLGDKGLARPEMAQELMDIAYEYGQTFDAVQETAVKFAQTGQNWEEVIDSTRATMLGLNTAELDVATATEGLIAVMAQFEVKSEDLEEVIDKINITADNFPITSQKIVEALQRAGGTAKAFGMSLEETIGVITALGKATGRAGSAIGTALNSLITFSMKGSSLEKFSEFLGKDVSNYGVLQVWTELSEAIKSAGDEGEAFAKKMATSADFSSLMNEELASAIGLTEEYEKATEETNQMIAEGKDIYSVVGTYRQNYFIALLNNIDVAIKAIQGMNSALGYSEQENITAMEAFSKKWNQLVISAKDLAIQFGNSGFLDFMKLVVNVSSEVLKLTKHIGGLNTVLTAMSALFLYVKRQQLAKLFHALIAPITGVRNAISVYRAYMQTGATATQAMAASVNALKMALGGIPGVLAIAVTAVSMIVGAIRQAREEAAQAREEAMRSGEEAVSNIEGVTKAYNEYRDVIENNSSSLDDINSSRSKMIELLGVEENDIKVLVDRNKELIGSYEDVDHIIKDLVEDEYALAKAKAEIALQAAKEEMESVGNLMPTDIGKPTGTILDVLTHYSDLLKSLSKDNAEFARQVQNILFSKPSSETIADDLEKLNQALSYIQRNYTSAEYGADKFYQALVEQIELYTKLKGNLTTAEENLELLGESFDEYSVNVANAKESTEEAEESLGGLAQEAITTADAIDSLNKKVDSFQGAYKTLSDVIDEYNKTGEMTADMLQSLLELEPEYLMLLEEKDGALTINEEKLQDLIATNDQYLDQLVMLQAAEAVDTMITEAQAASKAGLSIEEYKLQVATGNLTTSTFKLIQQLYNGEISAQQFKNAVKQAGEEAGVAADLLNVLADGAYNAAAGYGAFISAQSQMASGMAVGDLDQIARSFGYDSSADPEFKKFWAKRSAENKSVSTNKYNQLTNNIKRYYSPSSSKSGGGGSSKNEDPFKEEKEALKELLDVYEHSILLLESKKDKFVGTANEGLQEALDAYNEEMRLVSEKNIDLTQTIFGNIDTNNRQVIEWTEENLAKFKNAYESWGDTAEDLKNSISTVYGMSSEYDGIEIAFSPMLQTPNGAVLLDADTVDKYIWGLLENVGENWHTEDLLRLDTEGLEIDGQKIKNLIADVGETAIKTGEAMHYVGKMGSVNLAKQALEEARANQDAMSGKRQYAKEVVAIYKKMQEAVHAQAERYRAANYSETSEEIRELQKLWLQYQEKIEEIMKDVYEEIVGTYENAISYLEHLYESAEERMDYSYMGENLKKQLDYQVKIQREAERELERLAQKGIDVNDDAAQAVIDRWYEAEKAIREISQKIAADILDPYDDFIDLADKFDIWEYMDFTKVDYLRDKLAAVNKLLQEGTITLKQYNEELKNISYAIFDAQKELYEKQKEDINNQLKETTDAYKAQTDALKNQKDEINDYYDQVIDGYNKEIEAWEKKKEEVSEYYDTLIENLRDVEKANERINRQVDYYNERQKIITNLEQAQARSGVEWREKEMEYQQQLLDLDEDWKRTLAEWDIEDRIAALEKLKETTIKDIELSIQKIRDMITAAEEAKETALKGIDEQIKAIEGLIEAAEKAAEEQVQVIEDKIKDLSKTIAEAIKNGTEDGLVNSREELDKALVDGTNAMLRFIDANEQSMTDSAKKTATDVFGIYKSEFITPMSNGIDEIAGKMKNALTSGIAEGAKEALSTLQSNLIEPLKKQMSSLMSQVSGAKSAVASSATSKGLTEYQKTEFKKGSGPVADSKPTIKFDSQWDKFKSNPPTQIYINNYNNTLDMASRKTAQNLRDILG